MSTASGGSTQPTDPDNQTCSFDVRYAVTDLSPTAYDAVMTVTSNRDAPAPLQIVYRFAGDRASLDLAYVNNAVIVTKGNGTLGVPTRLKTSTSYRRGQQTEISSGVVAVGRLGDGFAPETRLGVQDLNVNGVPCEAKGGGLMGYETCMNAMSFFTSFNGRPPPARGADECAMVFCCGVVPVVVEEAVVEEASVVVGDVVAVGVAPTADSSSWVGGNGGNGSNVTSASSNTGSSNTGVLIGAVVGVAAALLVVVLASLVVIRRRRQQRRVNQGGDGDGDGRGGDTMRRLGSSSSSSSKQQLSRMGTSPFASPTNRISLAASTVGVNSHHLATQGSLSRSSLGASTSLRSMVGSSMMQSMSSIHEDGEILPTPIDHLPDDLPEDVILHEKLGAGAFGTVFKGEWGGHTVAVKVLQTAYASDSREMDSFRQEIAVLSGLRHPNIVAFLAACTIPPDICIVEELAEGGSLHSKLHGTSGEENRCRPMPADRVVQVAIDVSQAMVYLHPNIVHRDLKSQNVLLDKDGTYS